RKCYEYIEDFVEVISRFIESLEVFPYFMIWECFKQEVPGNIAAADEYILRNAAPKELRNAPVIGNKDFDYPRDEYWTIPTAKNDFEAKCRNYFESGRLGQILEIPLKPGYRYFDLPIFSDYGTAPQWILTLIYGEEAHDRVSSEDFFDMMEHISRQTGIAWDRFQNDAANKLMKTIDNRLAEREKTRSDSTIDHLKKTARILSREIDLDWCAFFIHDEQANTLRLEADNMDIQIRLDYSLDDAHNIPAASFNMNKSIRLTGRKNLESILGPEEMKIIEAGVRKIIKQVKFKADIKHFTRYILFEHALFIPVAVGEKKKGIIAFFRAKKSQISEPEPQEKFEYETRPFSEFDVFLLKKIRRYVFNIFIFNQGVQRRMGDVRNIIDQIVNPMSEAITATGMFIPRGAAIDIQKLSDLIEKLRYINALSRITVQYARNFEILLDIDTGNLSLKKEKISDLRGYLIQYAMLYTPLIRSKCISINVTRETPSSIAVAVDKDLFDMVISNIIDNAIKYSFDPEEREDRGLQAKPKSTANKENVLIEAKEVDDAVIITVSSYGIELTEDEKKKIFDREYRGHRADDRSKGAGIGLFLAREIVEKHGGVIEAVGDTPKHNTVFKIALPKIRQGEKQP
ncbi:MAG: HAMP domain-containing histidine kinase, partial [Candidatus Aminicenantes bacterium]|nr:HAMP domain-containing histidine kinase [Candidatus Aminicenantes bacterium]